MFTLTKGYFKNFWKMFAIFSAMVTPVVIAWNIIMVEWYCTRGNTFFGLFYFSGNELCPILSSLTFIISIVLGIMAFALMLSIIFDLITLPIKTIIRKRKNKIEIVENIFFK